MLQYKSKFRLLRVKTLDESVKTLQVDESQTVAELVKAVCTKIGKARTMDINLAQWDTIILLKLQCMHYIMHNKCGYNIVIQYR